DRWCELQELGAFQRARNLIKDYLMMGTGWLLYQQAEERGLDPSMEGDWKRIAEFLPELGTPSPAVATMMDEYVHDSIAGFLPEWASEDEVVTYLKGLAHVIQILDDPNIPPRDKAGMKVSDEQRRQVAYYQR